MSLLEQTQAKLEVETAERHRLEQLLIHREREISRIKRSQQRQMDTEHKALAEAVRDLLWEIYPDYSGYMPDALRKLREHLCTVKTVDGELKAELRDELIEESRG